MKTNPYLNFDGNAEEAMHFYKKAFKSPHDVIVMPMSDVPDSDKIPDNEKNRMMHCSIQVSDHCTIMASDIFPSMGHTLKHGNECYISMHPTSREAADDLFNALSEGGDVEMPMEDQFWGDYFGSLKDRYGINWMINFNKDY